MVAGIKRSSSQNCQLLTSRSPGIRRSIQREGFIQRGPDDGSVDRPVEKKSNTAGNRKAFRLPAREKSIDAGWRRCSDGIVSVPWKQVRAQPLRQREVEP